MPVNRSSLGCAFEIVETLVLTVVIFLVIQNFVAQPYRVEQMSMERTLEQGQYVLVDKLSPRWDSYSRGDIVVFRPPESTPDDVPFIKRVIGVAGDRVEIRNGDVLVNGVALDESSYVYDGQPTDFGGEESGHLVEDGTVFVLGDHRSNSADSRVFGSVPVENVIGRAVLRYWPISTLSILETPRYPDLVAQGT
ncbi:MAG: signal peptidase I [Chloroflexi bacterium]|nr:signal peptidase I [Chloroflexota bacterium]